MNNSLTVSDKVAGIFYSLVIFALNNEVARILVNETTSDIMIAIIYLILTAIVIPPLLVKSSNPMIQWLANKIPYIIILAGLFSSLLHGASFDWGICKWLWTDMVNRALYLFENCKKGKSMGDYRKDTFVDHCHWSRVLLSALKSARVGSPFYIQNITNGRYGP
jgi:hypothetical protein